MSIINQMLKDLEARKQSDVELQHSYSNALPQVHSHKKYWWAGGSIILVASFGVLIYSLMSSSPTAMKPIQIQKKVAVSQSPPKTTAKPVNIKQAHVVKPKAKAHPIVISHVPKVIKPNLAKKAITLNKALIPLTIKQKANQAYKKALAQASNGNYLGAITTLRAILTKAPRDLAVRESLAAFLMKENEYQQASEVLEVGLMQKPNYAPFTMLQARIYISQSQLKEALDLLLQSSPSMSNYPDYYALMAALYEKLQQPDLANQLYQDLVAIAPRNGHYWLGYAITLQQLDKLNEAAEAYKNAIMSHSLSPQLQAFVETQLQNIRS